MSNLRPDLLKPRANRWTTDVIVSPIQLTNKTVTRWVVSLRSNDFLHLTQYLKKIREISLRVRIYQFEV